MSFNSPISRVILSVRSNFTENLTHFWIIIAVLGLIIFGSQDCLTRASKHHLPLCPWSRPPVWPLVEVRLPAWRWSPGAPPGPGLGRPRLPSLCQSWDPARSDWAGGTPPVRLEVVMESPEKRRGWREKTGGTF